MIRILSRITSEPWAITSESMEMILQILQRENESPQAVAARLGRPLDNTYAVENRDGIAVLPVNGPLFRYADFFTEISGATSYDRLATDFARSRDDTRISSILLNLDSPGGEANGCSEFADMVFASRGIKPIVAYVGGSACSAAYWIASAADEIVIGDTAILGSIGTVLGIADTRERDAKAGVRRMEIVSSQSPYKRVDPTTEEGHGRLLARVDALSEVFIAKVARNRGVSVDTVMREFGQGDVFVGQAAVQAGLADRVGSFEALVAEMLSGTYRRSTSNFNVAAGDNNQEDTMSDKTAAPAGEQKPNTTADTTTAAPATVTTTTSAAPAAALPSPAEERARIKTIMSSEEAKGRGELAEHLAYETDMAPAAAIAMLAKAPKAAAAANSFDKLDAAMKAAGNANVGADTSANDTQDDAGDALVAMAKSMNLAR